MVLPAPDDRIANDQKIPRRERENMRQRAEILDAALRLFSTKGYHNVSMHEIAAEAEFGIGTLYKFFSNKEGLYKALIIEMAVKCHDLLSKALDEEKSPLVAIEKYIRVRQELFFGNLPLMRLYFAETTGASFNIKSGLDRDILRLYDEMIDKLASVFERGICEEIFRNVNPYSMALALEGSLNAILWRMMEAPLQFKGPADITTVSDIFFRGVLREAGAMSGGAIE